jgi:hypothetical protein
MTSLSASLKFFLRLVTGTDPGAMRILIRRTEYRYYYRYEYVAHIFCYKFYRYYFYR